MAYKHKIDYHLAPMDTAKTLFSSARASTLGTALSRVSGLARDMAMAFFFGSSPEIAAFMVAYRLANLGRRLIGEGNLQAGFTPHYEALKKGDPARAAAFFYDLSGSLGLVAFLLVALIEAALWAAGQWASPGWREIASLAMWIAPGLFFISLTGLNTALLQCERRYFAPAASPVLFNIGWIIAACLAPSMPYLALGITFAYALQWLFLHFRARSPLSPPAPVALFSPDVRQIIRPIGLGIIGVGALQINSALDAIFARLADPSGPAYLWYAIRIDQLPMGLFGVALSGALLPPLARAMQEGDQARYRFLLDKALTASGKLMAFFTVGYWVLGIPGINLLYGRGGFSPAAVLRTAECLTAYSFGLAPAVYVLLFAAGFYARKDYRAPTGAALVAVAVNVIGNALLVFLLDLGAASIAYATSVAAFVNCQLLARRLGVVQFWSRQLPIWISLLPAGALAYAAWRFLSPSGEPLAQAFSAQLTQFLVPALLYAGAAFLALRVAARFTPAPADPESA
jgi:putative peptidoglycan lipid II flippase